MNNSWYVTRANVLVNKKSYGSVDYLTLTDNNQLRKWTIRMSQPTFIKSKKYQVSWTQDSGTQDQTIAFYSLKRCQIGALPVKKRKIEESYKFLVWFRFVTPAIIRQDIENKSEKHIPDKELVKVHQIEQNRNALICKGALDRTLPQYVYPLSG